MGNRLILSLIAALVIGALVWRYYPQPAEPGSGQPIVSVTVPDLDAGALAGKTGFEKYCASCHGINAAGQDGIAPPLVHEIYEPGHHGDQSFFLAARQGVRAHHWPFGNMPPVEDIGDQEIAQIVNYIRALQRANGIN
jgi:mono/diheme cytochrome c family protein